MNCRCCLKPIPAQRRGDNALTEHCDPVCYAAAHVLQPTALHFWRKHCSVLPVSMYQARFDAVVSA